MYCKNCGIEMPDDSKFCYKCGVPVTTETTLNQIDNGETKKRKSKKSLEFYDELMGLNQLIQSYSNSLFSASSDKNIVDLLSQTIDNKVENAELLILNYKKKFKVGLIDELKNLSNNYLEIKDRLKPFIELGIIEKEYPHKLITLSDELAYPHDGIDKTKTKKNDSSLIENQVKENSKSYWPGIIILIIVIIVFNAWIDSPNEASSSTDQQVESQADKETPTYNVFTAYRYASEAVKQNLKAPGTAKFPERMEQADHVTELGEGKFIVNSWVDSQNGFGALIRTRWTCTIIFNGDDVKYENFKLFE